jgi:hypothetical protein
MSFNRIAPFGKATVSITAGNKLAVYTRGEATVNQQVGYPNVPSQETLVSTVNNEEVVTSAFSAASTVVIYAGAEDVLYEQGTAPLIMSRRGERVAETPSAVNATATLTIDELLSGIITSTTAAAVTGTLPTGTLCDAGAEFAIGDSFDWSVIVTGGTNDFTVGAGTGHTIVGAAVVTHSTSGVFRTKKTAANTFVTYRIG